MKRARKLYSYLVSFVKSGPLWIIWSVMNNHASRPGTDSSSKRQDKENQALAAFPQFEKGKIL